MATSTPPPYAVQQAVVALYRQGRVDEALDRARALTQAHPQDPFGWRAVGALLREKGRSAEAVEPLRRAALLAGDAGAYNDLGVALHEAGDFAEAQASLAKALALEPDLVEAHANLGRLHHALGQPARAEEHLRAALQSRPDLAEAHNTLAAVLLDGGRMVEAEAACRRAIALKPDYVDAHTLLGSILSAVGRLADAEACFHKAVELQPDDLSAHSNLLFNQSYRAALSPLDSLQEARRYGQRAATRARQPYTHWTVERSPQTLRVGLVSGDLRQHPVGYFLAGLLSHLDRGQLELHAYPTRPTGDALTERLRARVAAWKPLYGHDDAAAARLVHADGIHVLLDLSGHTAHNRLPVFAFKPAPVQVTWLGYFATTGLSEMDYLLADPVSVPLAHQGHFSEAIWYLPDTRLCFTPPPVELPVAPLPARAGGPVTFGNFQNLAKLGDEVLARWAAILAGCPGARLRLQNKQLADAGVREQLRQRLRGAGIDAQRVAMHGPQPRQAYLAAYGEVDLVLDSFPYPGGTTTCEALWMGVPTVTLAGDRLIARQGASLLSAAGLADWVAATPAEYVDKALAFARDLPALAGLRARLRAQMLASPLCDAPRFAQHLESALWAMWQRWQSAAG